MDEIKCAHVDSDLYDESDLKLIGLNDIARSSEKFIIRVFRRNNVKDFKEMEMT